MAALREERRRKARERMSDMSLERRAERRQFRYDPSKVRGEEVYRDARRHGRLVRWLKIVLPALAGTAVLVFLLAMRTVTGDLADLFSLAGVSMDTQNLVMDKPHLSGFKGTEHSYEVLADRAVQDLSNPKVVHLENIRAQFGLSEASTVSLNAANGVFDADRETLRLHNGITVSTTDGYKAALTGAAIDFRQNAMQSEEGQIEISAPEGRIRAKSLTVADRGKKVRFDGGVSVTYLPPPEAFEAPAAPPPEPAPQ